MRQDTATSVASLTLCAAAGARRCRWPPTGDAGYMPGCHQHEVHAVMLHCKRRGGLVRFFVQRRAAGGPAPQGAAARTAAGSGGGGAKSLPPLRASVHRLWGLCYQSISPQPSAVAPCAWTALRPWTVAARERLRAPHTTARSLQAVVPSSRHPQRHPPSCERLPQPRPTASSSPQLALRWFSSVLSHRPSLHWPRRPAATGAAAVGGGGQLQPRPGALSSQQTTFGGSLLLTNDTAQHGMSSGCSPAAAGRGHRTGSSTGPGSCPRARTRAGTAASCRPGLPSPRHCADGLWRSHQCCWRAALPGVY